MTNEEFRNLANKYEKGTATEEEKLLFEKSCHLLSKRYGEWDDHLMDSEQEVRHRIFLNLMNNIQQYERQRSHLKLQKYIAAAALLFAIGLGCLYFYKPLSDKQASTDSLVSVKTDKMNSDNAVCLQLKNGQRIILDELPTGKIAEDSGCIISKAEGGKIVYSCENSVAHPIDFHTNTIEIPYGKQYQVVLADGTAIWLNSASTLTYPVAFNKKNERKVALDGEAYFEVAKDKNKPFIVSAKRQEIKVLGTHFNVNSYHNEPLVKTTLLEGAVQVKGNNGLEKILKPGEQSELAENGKLTVNTVDVELAIAWKNRQFIFESERIETIMRMIERRYNVQVEYIGEKSNERFGGGFSEFDRVAKILKSLESTGKVRFEIRGKKILVYKS